MEDYAGSRLDMDFGGGSSSSKTNNTIMVVGGLLLCGIVAAALLHRSSKKKTAKGGVSVEAASRGVMPATGAGAVTELTDSDAARHKLLNSNAAPSVVLFYANWCGHCKAMLPDYEQAAAALPEVSFYRIEASKLGGMKSGGGVPEITGYPTLMTQLGNNKPPNVHVGRHSIEQLMDILA